MTYTVVLTPNNKNTQSVHDAIMWCDRHFGADQYSIENQFPSWNWKFIFHNAQQATHFALKWIQ